MLHELCVLDVSRDLVEAELSLVDLSKTLLRALYDFGGRRVGSRHHAVERLAHILLDEVQSDQRRALLDVSARFGELLSEFLQYALLGLRLGNH